MGAAARPGFRDAGRHKDEVRKRRGDRDARGFPLPQRNAARTIPTDHDRFRRPPAEARAEPRDATHPPRNPNYGTWRVRRDAEFKPTDRK